MDSLLKLLQTPAGTILFFAGIIILFFAFFEVSKGTIKMRRKPKEGAFPAVIGAVLIISGLIMNNNSQTAALGEPTPTPLETTETALVVPTATIIPPTDTASPTIAPILPTETATPIPIRTFSDSCIDAQVWSADSTNAEAVGAVTTQNNCLHLGSLGITAQDGTLHLLQRSPRDQSAAGIYTPIGNQSVIEFKVFVNSLYLSFENNPVYITFSIAPESSPMARRESGRFKLQVNDTGESPFVLFMLADVGESNGVGLDTEHYIYRNTYDIRLELKGIFMNMYINDRDTKQSIIIPSGPNVFYIGYNVPSLAVADVEIRDVVIDGVRK